MLVVCVCVENVCACVGGGGLLLKDVTYLPQPPWFNYHVQPSVDEITGVLTLTPTWGGTTVTQTGR